jgi:hypothetical protein
MGQFSDNQYPEGKTKVSLKSLHIYEIYRKWTTFNILDDQQKQAVPASASILLGFNPEDGGDMFLQNIRLSLTTWHYNSEDNTLPSHYGENLNPRKYSTYL